MTTPHRPGPARRSAVLATAAGSLVLLLTACSGGGAPGPGATSPPPASVGTPTTGSASPAPSAPGPSSTSSTPPGTSGGSERCTTADLAVGVRVPDGAGAAGSTTVLLTFRDTSSDPCTLEGFPGVSFVGDGDGTQLGAPAARSGTARRVTLRPGASTTAALRVGQAGNYPAATCRPVAADGLRVYPPGSREAAFVPYVVTACSGSTGSSPQLGIRSVGTGA